MDHETEVIRSQMEETRHSLADKLETLENQVVGSVQQATAAVTDTVETVRHAVEETMGTAKESVHDTVEAIKETFDLHRQVDHHPWAMVGGSMMLGFLAGRLLPASQRRSEPDHWPERFGSREQSQSRFRAEASEAYAAAPREQPPAAARTEPSLVSKLNESFGPEIDKLKGLAIGTTLGLLRDLAAGYLPEQMRPDVVKVMDNVTEKLGGKPLSGPVLGQFSKEQRSSTAEPYAGRERSSYPGR